MPQIWLYRHMRARARNNIIRCKMNELTRYIETQTKYYY